MSWVLPAVVLAVLVLAGLAAAVGRWLHNRQFDRPLKYLDNRRNP